MSLVYVNPKYLSLKKPKYQQG